MDVIPRIPLRLGQSEYHLVCNLNVVADIQDRYDGSFAQMGEHIGRARELLFMLACMINEDRAVQARLNGRPVLAPIQEAELGSMIAGNEFQSAKDAVMKAVTSAFPPADKSKNGSATAAAASI